MGYNATIKNHCSVCAPTESYPRHISGGKNKTQSNMHNIITFVLKNKQKKYTNTFCKI